MSRPDPTVVLGSGNRSSVAAIKAALTSRVSTAVLAADPDLAFPVKKGQIWTFRAVLIMTCGTTGGLAVALSLPAASVGNAFAIDLAGGSNAAQAPIVIGTEILSIVSITGAPVEISGSFTAAIDGNCAIMWAQKVSNGTATICGAASTLTATRTN